MSADIDPFDKPAIDAVVIAVISARPMGITAAALRSALTSCVEPGREHALYRGVDASLQRLRKADRITYVSPVVGWKAVDSGR